MRRMARQPCGGRHRTEVYTAWHVRCYILPRYKSMLRDARRWLVLFARSGRRGVQPPGIDDTPEGRASSEPFSEHPQPEPRDLQRVEATLLRPANEAETLKAVCSYITQHPGDSTVAGTLAALVRALDQDANAFNFESLDCLGPVTRRHQNA